MALSESPSAPTKLVHGHLSRIMQALQRSAAVSYIVDSQYHILYCNPAWNGFARSNGAPQLTSDEVVGLALFDVIPDVLKAVYADAFQQVLSTGRVWEQPYECSSPTVFRMYRMRIHLLKPQDWLAVTNPLVVERSHPRTAPADPNTYVDGNGLVTMCAHCRCSRRVDNPDQWDFVPDYLQPKLAAVKVSHGLCPVCRAYFYRLS